MDLIAFVRARLDEDEVLARQAAWLAGPDWTWKTEVPEGYGAPADYITALDGTVLLDTMAGIASEAPHVARHDPARVLREVAAGRARIALYLDLAAEYQHTRHGADMMRRDALLAVLRCDAAVWSDHPDYHAGEPS